MWAESALTGIESPTMTLHCLVCSSLYACVLQWELHETRFDMGRPKASKYRGASSILIMFDPCRPVSACSHWRAL